MKPNQLMAVLFTINTEVANTGHIRGVSITHSLLYTQLCHQIWFKPPITINLQTRFSCQTECLTCPKHSLSIKLVDKMGIQTCKCIVSRFVWSMYDADFPAHFWYHSTGKNSAIEFNQTSSPPSIWLTSLTSGCLAVGKAEKIKRACLCWLLRF